MTRTRAFLITSVVMLGSSFALDAMIFSMTGVRLGEKWEFWMGWILSALLKFTSDLMFSALASKSCASS